MEVKIMTEDENKEKEISQTTEDEVVQQAWWRESAFVEQGESWTAKKESDVPSLPNLFETLKPKGNYRLKIDYFFK